MVDPMEMDDISSEPDLVTDRFELFPKRVSGDKKDEMGTLKSSQIKTIQGMKRSEERRVSAVKEQTKELPIQNTKIHRARENDHPLIEVMKWSTTY